MGVGSWGLRAGALAVVVTAVAGCGVVPVPRVLRPVLGPPPSYTSVSLCIVDPSAPRGLRVTEAQKEQGSGRLFVQRDGRRRRVHRSREGGYAGEEGWFRDREPIRQYGRRYVKFGPHRAVPADALTRGADHMGVPVFLDRGDTRRPAALYVPVEPGCIFQPYVAEARARER